MFALLSDTTSDAQRALIGGLLVLIGTVLKMLWSDRTRGQRIEDALRRSFAKERADRELEVTAEKEAAKKDYEDSKARHKEIHDREIAGYIAQQDDTRERVKALEARVLELTNEIIGLKR